MVLGQPPTRDVDSTVVGNLPRQHTSRIVRASNNSETDSLSNSEDEGSDEDDEFASTTY